MAMTPFRDGPGSARSIARSLMDASSSIFSKPFDLWDPMEHFNNSLGDDGPMRSLFQDVRAIAGTKVDWKETNDAHVFKADLPGLNKDDVKLTVEDGRILQISGERSREKEEKSDTWHRVERSHGRFLRRFQLPDNANIDNIQAKVESGVLTVTVAKSTQDQKPHHRSIEIK